MNILDEINKEHISSMNKEIPEFGPGDRITVSVRVVEENRTRTQQFEGVCIARSNNENLKATFTVRKTSFGEGVERIFPLYSPLVEKITVLQRGKVRRAKLYYLRERSGKSARIEKKENYSKKKTDAPATDAK